MNIRDSVSMQTTPVIEVHHLTKQVSSTEGGLTILDDISFQIEAGSSLAVVGASGSGKSTLLGLLAGLDVPSKGRVLLDGVDMGALDEDGRAQQRAGRVGFVFQSFQLLPSLTALENVMLPLELAGNTDPREAALQVLERVGLSGRLRHYPSQLSGGEQQRCAIARAFAIEPRILFADEPTGNLDQRTGARVIELLLQMNKDLNTTLVLVTHDPALAERCDAQLELDAGCIVGHRGPVLMAHEASS
jgi:putative ABC transport system ATP-binding protein